jgi:poly-gamma-glutamate capsule biosynthesis protein CapA/YwtB (metallophosphatase superfamily)
MRRLLEWVALALALTASAARADIAPPPPQGVAIAAGDLVFLVVAHDYRSAEGVKVTLDGCVEGRPNCALARAENVVGAQVTRVDGEPLQGGLDAAGQILAAFGRADAPATIVVVFAASAPGEAPIAVEFARR